MEELIKQLHDHGITSEDLDDMVHDMKAAEAAEINNGGIEDQVEYLIGCYGLLPLRNALKIPTPNRKDRK